MRCDNVFLSFETHDPSSASTKVHASSDLSLENLQYIKALGVVCSELGLLPTPLERSGLEKDGERAVASGGSAEFWRGRDSGDHPVAFKAFRLGGSNLKKAKGVSKNESCEVWLANDIYRSFGNRYWCGRN